VLASDWYYKITRWEPFGSVFCQKYLITLSIEFFIAEEPAGSWFCGSIALVGTGRYNTVAKQSEQTHLWIGLK
jgi:hypothetical protein